MSPPAKSCVARDQVSVRIVLIAVVKSIGLARHRCVYTSMIVSMKPVLKPGCQDHGPRGASDPKASSVAMRGSWDENHKVLSAANPACPRRYARRVL